MTTFARNDRSILGRWWWTVDRWTLGAIGLLIAIGMMMSLAASPAVATRIRLDSFSLVLHLAAGRVVTVPWTWIVMPDLKP